MRITFLGTGTSRGIPVIGCDCSVCRSDDPRNKRLRASVLIQSGVQVVIDTSADFRQQMIAHDVRRLDAAVFTHSHVDHILGLDDVFPFNVRNGCDFPIFAQAETMREIEITFRHLFVENKYPRSATIRRHVIDDDFEIGDLTIRPIEAVHGKLPVLGYRIGSFAYLTDVNHIPGHSIEKLQGLEVLVLDGLRYRPHPTHFSISEAAEMADRLQAGQTYLTHMCHDVEHVEANRALPPCVQLAYDGLSLELTP